MKKTYIQPQIKVKHRVHHSILAGSTLEGVENTRMMKLNIWDEEEETVSSEDWVL